MSLFGDRIKALRGEEKQEAVAKEIGTTAQSLGRYEKGKHKPDIEIALKLADYYNTTVDYLLGRTNAKSIDPNIQSICNYTGLSEEAITKLNSSKDNMCFPVLSDLILDIEFIHLLYMIYKKNNTDNRRIIDYGVGINELSVFQDDLINTTITNTILRICERLKTNTVLEIDTEEEKSFRSIMLKSAIARLNAGEITVEEYDNMVYEYGNGNYNYNPHANKYGENPTTQNPQQKVT